MDPRPASDVVATGGTIVAVTAACFGGVALDGMRWNSDCVGAGPESGTGTTDEGATATDVVGGSAEAAAAGPQISWSSGNWSTGIAGETVVAAGGLEYMLVVAGAGAGAIGESIGVDGLETTAGGNSPKLCWLGVVAVALPAAGALVGTGVVPFVGAGDIG